MKQLSSSFITLAVIAMTAGGFASVAEAQFDSATPAGPALPKSEGPLGPWLDLLQPRSLGPVNMAGRIMDIAVYEKNPHIFFVASASGGVWKTVNGGTTFEAIFDKEGSISLGSVAVSQKNPNVLYVGTGEQSSRNSVAWGDGVYKSIDGGKTWKNIGLKDTRHISKVIIDPRNDDVVYVAAVGRLWGKSEDRGLYKTTNGGKTWQRVFATNDVTGVIDLDVDPKDPNTLYVSAWERLRKPYVFYSGGYAAGLYKSTDGGKSWIKLSKGLPPSPVGRIGLSIFPKNPKIMIATVEYRLPGADGAAVRNRDNQPAPGAPVATTAPAAKPADAKTAAAKPAETKKADTKKAAEPDVRYNIPTGSQFNGGGLFMSKDGGESWELVRQINPRPFYFSTPLIDPNDPKVMYVCGMNLHRTTDGGKTWKQVSPNTLHADHHALWVNPKDSKHIIDGNDGGVSESKDFGDKWEHFNKMPIGQFYAVAADYRRPYWVYGGLQDNGSWALPTQTKSGGPTAQDAINVGGGDGFHVQVDPKNWEWLYTESQGGAVGRINQKTGDRAGIRPVDTAGNKMVADLKAYAEKVGKTPEDKKIGNFYGLRFNWSTPILLSPHDPKTVYVGANKLMMSTSRGDTGSWKAISPDLTTNSRRKTATSAISRRISVNEEATGAENHCTIVTISESPIKKGWIATGSDDGMVHVTTNGGKTWTDVTPNIPDLNPGIWCSRVILSKWSENRLYATFDGHRSDDFKPYVYVSEDLGKTWSKINTGLPDWDCVYVIKEGAKNPNLLYLGSEMSLRFSLDRGQTWSRLRGSFPTVAVHDVVVQEEFMDLVIGTHGRSIYTMDVSALEGMTPGFDKEDAAVFTPQPILRLRSNGPSWDGDQVFQSPNTQPGTRIYYHLKKDAKQVQIFLVQPNGGQDELTSENAPAKTTEGLNAFRFTGRVGGFRVLDAGEYKINVKVDGKVYSTTLKVLEPTND